MNNITKIGEAILAVLTAWAPGVTVAENLMNCVSAFVKAAPETNLLPAAIVKDMANVEASMAAINAGDVAILGTVPLEGKSIALFAIDNASPLATRMFGTGNAA